MVLIAFSQLFAIICVTLFLQDQVPRLSDKDKRKIVRLKESRKELMGELSYQMELVDIGEKTGQETKCLNERIGMLFKKVNALNEVVDKVYGVVPEVALIPESKSTLLGKADNTPPTDLLRGVPTGVSIDDKENATQMSIPSDTSIGGNAMDDMEKSVDANDSRSEEGSTGEESMVCIDLHQ